MRLTTKYNLILISVLLTSLVIIGSTSYYILHKHAKEEVIKQAAVLMEAALAMRKYTINEIKPLLALQNKRNFLPQSVPSYAATQNFEALREKHSEYRYKEATLNPTNPRDRATDWETDIIQEFRNSGDKDQMTLVRDTALGATLYYARPIRIQNEGCLTCHGTIEDAPETMIALYGPANGFGWKMNEVVGSQIVSVPLSLPVQRANETFYILMSIVTAVFLILYFILMFFSRQLFLNKAPALTTVADHAAEGGNVHQDENVTDDREVSASRFITPGRDVLLTSERNDVRKTPKYTVNLDKSVSGKILEEHSSQFEQTDSAVLPEERSSLIEQEHAAEHVVEDSLQFGQADSAENTEEDIFHLERADSTEILAKPSPRSQMESAEKLKEKMFQIERSDATEILDAHSPRLGRAGAVDKQDAYVLDLDREYTEDNTAGDKLYLGEANSEENPGEHKHELDEESPEEDIDDHTFYIKMMLQKHEMAASGIDEAFDVDEAITNLSSGAFEVSQLTDSGEVMTQAFEPETDDESDDHEYQTERSADGK